MRRRVNVRGIIINENGEIFLPIIDRHNGSGAFGVRRVAA